MKARALTARAFVVKRHGVYYETTEKESYQMQMIPITDALDAVQKNARAFILMAEGKVGDVNVSIDHTSGTASIFHTRDLAGIVTCSIRFPAMPAQLKLSRVELDRWTAYFIHEISHALYTDPVAWKRAVSLRLHELVNGMEDPRIERKLNKKLVVSNSKELLNALMAWAVSEVPATANLNDPRQLPWALALAGRIRLCGYSLPQGEQQLLALNASMRRLVDGAMARLDKAKDTDAVVEIAIWLQSELAAGNAGNGKPDGKPADDGKGEQGEQGKGEQGKGSGEAGKGSGAGASGSPVDATQCAPVKFDPLSEATKKASDATRKNGSAASNAIIIDAIRNAQKSADKIRRYRSTVHTPYSLAPIATKLKARAMQCGKLRSQVARVLKAEETETWQHGRVTGRLDRSALHRAAMGLENSFSKRTIATGYETEIEVLVDGSSSMGGEPMEASAVLALVISQAAQQVGVKCSVVRFSANSYSAVKETADRLGKPEMDTAFAGLAVSASGSTPLSTSIVKSAARLAMRAPSKRKMLFVITDGACDHGDTCVKVSCDYAESLAVETVGLCIDVPVHPGFRLGVVCRANDIAGAGLGVLVRALERAG